jgi:hypothetical protein
MPPVADYSTTPSDNTSISGLTVSDATVADTLDNIVRQMMADIRAADNANAKPADNETVTGNWTVSGTFTLSNTATFNAAAAFNGATTLAGATTISGPVTFGDAAQVRAALAAMPIIQLGAGVGQILTLDAASGAALRLPGSSAQTYAFWFINQTVSNSALGTSAVGVSPGNTLLNAGAPGVILRGFCIRLT